MQFTSMILSNAEVSPGYWRMRMTAPQEFSAASPGQFVMVRVNGAIDPLLRRPFGIFDVGRDIYLDRCERVLQVVLLQRCGEEFAGLEGDQILPVKLAASHHAASAHREHFHHELRTLLVVAEQIAIILAFQHHLLPL